MAWQLHRNYGKAKIAETASVCERKSGIQFKSGASQFLYPGMVTGRFPLTPTPLLGEGESPGRVRKSCAQLLEVLQKEALHHLGFCRRHGLGLPSGIWFGSGRT